MPLFVKIILLGLAFVLSLSAAAKALYFLHLSFNSTSHLIDGISSDLRKLLKYFNDTAIVTIFRIPFSSFGASGATMFPNNSALYLKDLK